MRSASSSCLTRLSTPLPRMAWRPSSSWSSRWPSVPDARRSAGRSAVGLVAIAVIAQHPVRPVLLGAGDGHRADRCVHPQDPLHLGRDHGHTAPWRAIGVIQIAASGCWSARSHRATHGDGLGHRGDVDRRCHAAVAVEVVVAKRLLVGVSAPLLGASRIGLGVLFLLGYLALSDRLVCLGSMTRRSMDVDPDHGCPPGRLRRHWFAALRDTPATTVTSVLVLAAVVTGTWVLREGRHPMRRARWLSAHVIASCSSSLPCSQVGGPCRSRRRRRVTRSAARARSCSLAMPTAPTSSACAVRRTRVAARTASESGDEREVRHLAQASMAPFPTSS